MSNNIYLIVAICLSLTNQLMLVLDKNKEFCIYKDLLSNDNLKVSYIVSGDAEVEKSVSVKIYDANQRQMYNNYKIDKNLSKDDVELKISTKTTYSICFTSTNDKVMVSFEIFTLSESGHIISLAKDETIDEVYKNITVVGYLFEEIEKNMKFFVERREVHAESK